MTIALHPIDESTFILDVKKLTKPEHGARLRLSAALATRLPTRLSTTVVDNELQPSIVRASVQ
jgi:hypothetical protein